MKPSMKGKTFEFILKFELEFSLLENSIIELLLDVVIGFAGASEVPLQRLKDFS